MIQMRRSPWGIVLRNDNNQGHGIKYVGHEYQAKNLEFFNYPKIKDKTLENLEEKQCHIKKREENQTWEFIECD